MLQACCNTLNADEQIITNIESQHCTTGIFLDFRKASHSIKHNILFDKLDRYGIRSIALDLIRYLQSHFQFVHFNYAESNLKTIK